MDSEKTPSLLIWAISVSPSWSRTEPSYCLGPVSKFVSHSWGFPVRQWRQCPQLETNDRMHLSPGLTRLTPSPTFVTTPDPLVAEDEWERLDRRSLHDMVVAGAQPPRLRS